MANVLERIVESAAACVDQGAPGTVEVAMHPDDYLTLMRHMTGVVMTQRFEIVVRRHRVHLMSHGRARRGTMYVGREGGMCFDP